MKKIFVLLMCSLVSSPLLAGDKNDVSSLNADWGNASDLLCKEHSIGDINYDMCFHDEKGCKEKSLQTPGTNDEYSNYLWIAMKVTKGGAYFCPIRIDARNKNQGKKTWTTYSPMMSSDEYCVWLCKDGYGGADCSESDADYVCDSTNLGWNVGDKFHHKNRSENFAMGLSTNVEDSVAMFSRAEYDKCGTNTREEHDRILAVVGWMEDITNKKFNYEYDGEDGIKKTGNAVVRRGAIVRQMMVRTGHGWEKKSDGDDDLVTWPKIYPATNSTEILLCKTGYRPDPISKKCVEINATRCQEQNLCNDYKTGFDETIHTMKLTDEGCNEYRCTEEGKAFASTTDRSCVDCPATFRSGPNSKDGTCLKCTQTEVYTGGSCGDAIGYTKTDLMYGKGKTRDSVPSIESQCWTVLDTDSYKKCVMKDK